MTVRDLNRRVLDIKKSVDPRYPVSVMSARRRVRFAEDSRNSSSHDTLAVHSWTLQSSSFIEGQLEEKRRLETSRAEQLENVRLAEQRAHDAMKLARSMQADIRSSNAKLQKSGAKPQGSPQSPTKPFASQLITSKETLVEKRADPQPDIWREHDIISMPMAWISDVLLLVK